MPPHCPGQQPAQETAEHLSQMALLPQAGRQCHLQQTLTQQNERHFLVEVVVAGAPALRPRRADPMWQG
jgi:hypothetical protein